MADPLDPPDPFDQAESKKDPDNNPMEKICKTINNICETTDKVSSTLFTVFKVIIIIFILVIVSRWIFDQDESIIVQPFETNIEMNDSDAVLKSEDLP
ncbi:hypothetical protein CVH13_01096 [Dehalococcoides mccartyi]|uniref:Uncharacterized protein n=1 Tax=Dehalococcoides mccartyi TaxID=61435 RepID=A0A2J1DWC0_9CHLR|nr:hypothetical protein CVH13_01096 [Dehalococcoides mccartyi]